LIWKAALPCWKYRRAGSSFSVDSVAGAAEDLPKRAMIPSASFVGRSGRPTVSGPSRISPPAEARTELNQTVEP
jgi:hypothetical protein